MCQVPSQHRVQAIFLHLHRYRGGIPAYPAIANIIVNAIPARIIRPKTDVSSCPSLDNKVISEIVSPNRPVSLGYLT